MVFTSFSFLLFLTAVVAVYFLCPVKYRWVVLLISSIAFYCLSDIKFLPFILGTALLSFLTAKQIQKIYDQCDEKIKLVEDRNEKTVLKEASKAKCRKLMLVALILIIGYLGVTKLGKYVIQWISTESGSVFSIIVPLGISYYSFSTVGYVLDIYWKRYRAESNFLKYLLYVSYFPHILQGPIARYNRLGVQFFQEHRFDYKRVCFGIQLIMWGFFQKLVIADRLSIFVKAVYEDYANQYGAILLIATVFYAIQIYTDFAGCVDIARGVSQIFGIELENNFRRPYFSRSVDEFWRRWHITLGAWFKDYLCMPVSVSKLVKRLSKKARDHFGRTAGKHVVTIFSLAAVWTCTGIWHGTGMNYVVWACWQGSIIIISQILEPVYVSAKKFLRINENGTDWKAFQLVRTFILTGIIPRVIVRAPSLDAAWVIFKNFFTGSSIQEIFNGSLINYGLSEIHLWIAVFAVVILVFVSVLKERGVSIRESVAQMNIVVRWMIYIVFFYIIVIFGIYGPGYDASKFVYMGF